MRRTSSARTLRTALIWLGLATALTAGIEVALCLHRPNGPVWVQLLFVAVGVEYVLAGLVAWSRRPSNRTGVLLCAGGLSRLAAALQNTDVPGLIAVGMILGVAPIAVILHILLAFPAGRCPGPATRGLVVAGYVITVVLQAPRYLFASAAGPAAVLQVDRDPGLVHLGIWVQSCCGAVVIVATALVLARRLGRATPAQRRVLAVLYPYGIAAILFLEIAIHILPPLFGFGPITVFVLQISAAAGIPVAFAPGCCAADLPAAARSRSCGRGLSPKPAVACDTATRWPARSETNPCGCCSGCRSVPDTWTRREPRRSCRRLARAAPPWRSTLPESVSARSTTTPC